MGLFDLFKKKEGCFNLGNFKYTSERICEQQDPLQSVTTDDKKYDMTRFSKHEEWVINSVLSAAERKYKGNYAAIGLANECYPIMYKPRYVLFEVLIQRYSKSNIPLDKIAVAFANWSKGARYFGEAAKLFEDAKNNVDWKKVHEFSSFGSFFSSFSEMYEKMHEYNKAIECMRLSLKYENLNREYSKKRILLLEDKQRTWKPYKPRRMSKDQEKFENLVSIAAERYV